MPSFYVAEGAFCVPPCPPTHLDSESGDKDMSGQGKNYIDCLSLSETAAVHESASAASRALHAFSSVSRSLVTATRQDPSSRSSVSSSHGLGCQILATLSSRVLVGIECPA